MSLIKSFDLQFFSGLFGGTKTTTDLTQVRKRDPEPEELTNLRLDLYKNINKGLETFDANSWANAQDTANNALYQQSRLLQDVDTQLFNNNNIARGLEHIARTGNIPSTLTDSLNASVSQGLKSSMGNMLNGLANRGVLNSSVTTAGTNQLAQAAADAYNRNYLSAYQAVLGGMGQALQGQQNNTSALLSALGAVGQVPGQAYEGVSAQLMPAFNLWSRWQNSYDTREDYDTIVSQNTKNKGCVTGDTLLRLADGQEIPISELKDDDEIKVWDFDKGNITSAPLIFFYKHKYDEDKKPDVIRVEFEDGSSVGVLFEHSFFDMTLGKFVAVNAETTEKQELVGHEFAKVDENGQVKAVKVTKIYVDGKADEAYGVHCKGHWNYLVNDYISGNDGQLGMLNMFEYDIYSMMYDKEQKEEDLAKYGKLSYDVFDGIVPKSIFESNNLEECSVAFGKGLVDKEVFLAFVHHFCKYFLEWKEREKK